MQATAVETIGAHNVVERDIAHSKAMYPDSQQRVMDFLKDLDPRVLRRVLQDSPSERYRISVE
jgi:hypothetical protein